jgi:Icc-related predicted phosphoesterase
MICVDGNHDWLSLAQVSRNRGARAYEVQPGEKVLFKGLTFSGFREIPKFHGRWKGEVERIKLSSLANIIMADSPDVLLTHAPPRGIMDRTDAGEHSGNEPLAIAMASHPHNVKLHCFGHVHECGGEQETHGSTLFSNAATKLNVIDL